MVRGFESLPFLLGGCKAKGPYGVISLNSFKVQRNGNVAEMV